MMPSSKTEQRWDDGGGVPRPAVHLSLTDEGWGSAWGTEQHTSWWIFRLVYQRPHLRPAWRKRKRLYVWLAMVNNYTYLVFIKNNQPYSLITSMKKVLKECFTLKRDNHIFCATMQANDSCLHSSLSLTRSLRNEGHAQKVELILFVWHPHSSLNNASLVQEQTRTQLIPDGSTDRNPETRALSVPMLKDISPVPQNSTHKRLHSLCKTSTVYQVVALLGLI